MLKKILKSSLVTLCIVISMLLAGCTPSGAVSYRLPEEKIQSAFNLWRPVAFDEHALYEYKIVFESTEVELYEVGSLSLKVGGRAPAGISIKYEASVFDSEIKGRVRGNKSAVMSKLKGRFSEDSLFSTMYSVLFEPMENEDMFSAMIADYSKLKIGESWQYTHGENKYEITTTQISRYGDIDGVELVVTLDGEFLFSMCISPNCPLPIMTLFTYEDDGSTTYVMCSLNKMYK
ncbi:MAG: hypothetical protein E7315_04555 [Clostridiales bacterium]|nr:hypothetical protein [Clostridiales bacterium]